MPGKPINLEQIKLYKAARGKGKTQKTAAAMAGISERSGRRIEKGTFRPKNKRKRDWRTHTDFFAEAWSEEIVPLLEKNHKLKAVALFQHLQQKYPGKYADSKLRTFQRRVSRWKARHIPTAR